LIKPALNEFSVAGKSIGHRKERINEFADTLVGTIIAEDGPGHAAFERKHVRARIQFETNRYILTFVIVEFDEKQT
jgi:hypothetical protein